MSLAQAIAQFNQQEFYQFDILPVLKERGFGLGKQ